MNINEEARRLNPWPFIAADALLLGTAFALGFHAPTPFALSQTLAIAGLVFAGAVAGLIPFILNWTRREDAALTERQREIASLAQTTAASAEQLSIATGSLQTMADHVIKSLKLVDTLPSKLQEKIHEFKEQLNEVSLNENEVLSQEVNTLRAAETERIESVVTTVRKLSGELARLEAATRKNVTELSDTLARFTLSTKEAASEASASFTALRSGAETSITTAHTAAMAAIESALARALASLENKLTVIGLPENSAENEPMEPRASSSTRDPGKDESHAFAYPGNGYAPTAKIAPPAEEVRTTRKKPARKTSGGDDDLSLGLETAAEPSSHEFNQSDPEEMPVPALSADGVTRLVVTSYIGIGNKLFVRGSGPGLSWEKGHPLEFVSIGKWRWETAEADSAVHLKIFKNDELECTALGELVVEPGQQREVSAKF